MIFFNDFSLISQTKQTPEEDELKCFFSIPGNNISWSFQSTFLRLFTLKVLIQGFQVEMTFFFTISTLKAFVRQAQWGHILQTSPTSL